MIFGRKVFQLLQNLIEIIFFVKGPAEAIAKPQANLGRATPREKCVHRSSQQPFEGMAMSFWNATFGTDLLSVQI